MLSFAVLRAHELAAVAHTLRGPGRGGNETDGAG